MYAGTGSANVDLFFQAVPQAEPARRIPAQPGHVERRRHAKRDQQGKAEDHGGYRKLRFVHAPEGSEHGLLDHREVRGFQEALQHLCGLCCRL